MTFYDTKNELLLKRSSATEHVVFNRSKYYHALKWVKELSKAKHKVPLIFSATRNHCIV